MAKPPSSRKTGPNLQRTRNAFGRTSDIKSEVKEWIQTIVGAVALAAFIMIFIARAYTVDGPSMLPTLHDSERLLVDKLTYRFREPQRGEIIVFKYPEDPSQHFIKRIIGVPGDTIMIRGGQVAVNGTVLEEEYLSEPTYGYYGPVTVPEETVFVLGDNRNNSEDSRDPRVGFVPYDHISGRAIFRYWPLSKIGVVPYPEIFESEFGAPAHAPPE